MNCKECDNSIFDEKWGEYKCKVKEHYIYRPLERQECEHYRKKSEKDNPRK